MIALSIRRDRTPIVLRKLAKAEADARVARRMLAIANALDGMSREEAARSAGMDRQTLRDWVPLQRARCRWIGGPLGRRAPTQAERAGEGRAGGDRSRRSRP